MKTVKCEIIDQDEAEKMEDEYYGDVDEESEEADEIVPKDAPQPVDAPKPDPPIVEE